MKARFLNNTEIVIAAESFLEEMALQYWMREHGSENPCIVIETKSTYEESTQSVDKE